MALTLKLTQAEILARVHTLAQQIDQDYQGQSPVVISVLKGSVLFTADLIRALQTPVQRLEFVRLASYGDRTISTGEVALELSLDPNIIRHQPVLVIEDIVDTGRSWQVLRQALMTLEPASLKLCALLDKPSRRQVPVTPDYGGFTLEDQFVVGYGLDWNEQYRQLPDLYAWEPDRPFP